MCLSYVLFTLVIWLINCWDFIQIWYNKMLSSQWDNNNQHFVYIIVSWYLLGIISRQGFLFSCSCMNRCTCVALYDGNTGKFLAVNLIMKPCLLILPWKTIILDDLLEERYRCLGCARSCGILEIYMMNSELFAVTSRPFEVVHQWPYSVADHVTVIQFDCWKEKNRLPYGVWVLAIHSQTSTMQPLKFGDR